MHMRHHVVRFLDDIEENGRENGKVSDSIVLVRFPNSLHKRVEKPVVSPIDAKLFNNQLFGPTSPALSPFFGI